MSVAGRLVLPVLLPRIVSDLHITSGTAGFALTVMGAMTALATYPGGRLADQLSTKTILIVSILLLTAGTVGFVRTSSYPGLLVGASVYGLGTGLYLPTAITQITELYRDKRGQALGINSASVNVGGVLVSWLAVPFVAASTWRNAFVPILIVLITLLGTVHVLHQGRYRVARPSFGIRATGKRLVSNARVRVILIATTSFAFAWSGITGFLPTYLHLHEGFSESVAGQMFALIFVVGILVNPIAGRVGDRLGYPIVTSIAGGSASLGIAIILLSSHLVSIATGIILFGCGAGAFWPVVNSDIMRTLPKSTRGGDYGAARTVWMVTGSFGTTYVGTVADSLNYVFAFTTLIPLLIITICVGISLSK